MQLANTWLLSQRKIMYGSPCDSVAVSGWRALYRAAIEETDSRAIPAKAANAERAILKRERELFYDSGTLEEKEDLEDALYLLRH